MPTSVHDCQFPSTTELSSAFVARAYYKDSYSVALKNAESSPVSLFNAIFGNRPAWMKGLMLGRNWLAARLGLEVSSPSEVLRPIVTDAHAVGGKIGGWLIYALTERELVAGRDNKHMDFRLSVIRKDGSSGTSAVVSTVCDVHNNFGKIYLFIILPFHKVGLRWLIASAASSGRL